ncbi:DUF4056 domain-containing protein [Flindersiella endophytica]
MDPALHRLAASGAPRDEVAVLLRLRDPAAHPRAARIVCRFGDIATARVRREAIRELWSDPATLSVKAPRSYRPDVEPVGFDVGSVPGPLQAPTQASASVEPAQSAEAEPRRTTDRIRPPGLTAAGRGVVIGSVDWGCDIAHPDLRRRDGRTRLLALWDQRPAAFGLAEPYGYGRILDASAINAALRTPDPYTSLGYDPLDFDAGFGAHGTHTLGIACGNGRGGGPAGMAPAADIVVVSLAKQGSSGAAPLGDSVELLEAIDFILRTAGDRPCVINLSLGRMAGEHTGHTLVELAMDHLLTAAPGRAIVQSCGNYFQRQGHLSWQLRAGDVHEFEVEVDAGDRTPNEVDLWYSGRDRLLVELATPDGRHRTVVPLGEQGKIERDGRVLAHVFHRAEDPNNHDREVVAYLEPVPGIERWRFTLTAQDVPDGRVHAWIERDNACRSCQSRFPRDAADARTTIGTIANGHRTLTVGAYDAHDPGRAIAAFSSSGPTRDGRAKPDLVAPGVMVLATRSRQSGPSRGPLYGRMSGTSMAAPAVTGTIALLFEAARRKLTIEETRRLLLAGCDPFGDGSDALRAGHGYLDPARVLESLTGSTQMNQPCGCSGHAAIGARTAEAGEETVAEQGGLRCPSFSGDADLAAVLAGRLRLGAPGTSPYPAPVRSKGSAVRKVQEQLVAAGFPMPKYGADGSFGRETGAAVVQFKTEHRIEPNDPVVGPQTLRKLDSLCATHGGGKPGCSPSDFRVAVIGGGFAGLMAAWSLHDGGFRVTVFEASGMLNGRVRTDTSMIPGKVLEAGAELIGENHPTWNLLAKKFKLTLDEVTEDYKPLKKRVILGGAVLTDKQLADARREIVRVQKAIGSEAAKVSAVAPWNATDAAALDAKTVAQRISEADMFGPKPSIARSLFEFVLENDQCAPLDRQSYLGLLAAVSAHAFKGDYLGYWNSTETHRCRGGNEQLGTLLAKGLPDVRLNSPVIAIGVDSDKVRVGYDNGTASVIETFDYVVLTTAPQVWPRIDSTPAFRPADFTMAHGPAVKHLNAFDTEFWKKLGLAPSVLSDAIGSVWEGTDNQHKPAKGAGLSVYSGSKYVLTASRYEDELEVLYKGYKTQPGRKSLLVDWPNEPWVRTGYSIPAPGQVTTIAKALSKPFRGRLFFAGEQASPGFYGYMEGALASGLRAAGQIALTARDACGARGVAEVAEWEEAMRGTTFSFAEDVEPAGLAEAVGPCPDVEVAPAARPKLLVRGSVDSAVRNAQARLNAYHAAEVSAGRSGLPGAPLREDCQFGNGTFGAVLAFQKQVFPGVPAEHDGRIGSHTWAKLDLFAPAAPPPVAPPVAVAPPSPPSPALAGPPTAGLGGRPCCLLESGSLRGATTVGGYTASVAGTVYTGKAGFVDFGHLWDAADLTGWVYQEIHKAGGASGTKIRCTEGEAELTGAAPASEWLTLARSIAFDDTFCHEISSYWQDQCGSALVAFGTHNSSFSPEDLCSNYLGTLVAERALVAGGSWVAALTSEVTALLASLDAQTATETGKAFDLIKHRWVDVSMRALDPCYLRRRNFTSVPWKTGHSSDTPTPAFVTAPFSLTATYEYRHSSGFKRADFTAQVTAIKTDAATKYGPDFDKR